MSTNRVSHFSTYMTEDRSPDATSGLEGFTANPFAASLSAWQMQIYQAAFAQAQADMEVDRNEWGEWCI